MTRCARCRSTYLLTPGEPLCTNCRRDLRREQPTPTPPRPTSACAVCSRPLMLTRPGRQRCAACQPIVIADGKPRPIRRTA